MDQKVIYVDQAIHQRLKMEAARLGCTIGELVARILDAWAEGDDDD